jgi:hypothetical protein
MNTSVICQRQVLTTPSHLYKGEKEYQPNKRGFTARVELRPFNNRALNRDVVLLCEQVLQASPQFPDGRLLSCSIHSARRILPVQVLRVTALILVYFACWTTYRHLKRLVRTHDTHSQFPDESNFLHRRNDRAS